MRCRVLLLGLAAAALCHPRGLTAQSESPPVPLDSRVRVTMQVPPGLEYVGRLQQWSADSLILAEPPAAPVVIQLSDVRYLEMSRGTHGHAGKGALIGGGVGAAVGVAFMAGNRSDDNGDPSIDDEAVGAVVLAAAGAGVGALVGALIREEEWRLIPRPFGSHAADRTAATR